MEVHAHTHTARKKWTHYFWEFLMLFLAVFCGFLAENKREHMVEHRWAKIYASNLYEELKKDTADINRSVRRLYSIANKLDSFCIVSSQQKKNNIPNSVLYYYASYVTNVIFYASDNTTIEQLKGSGNLRLLGNEISQKVSHYIKQLNGLENEYELTKAEFIRLEELYFKLFDGNTTQLLDPSIRHQLLDSVYKLSLPLITDDPKLLKEFTGWVKFEVAVYRAQVNEHLVPIRNTAIELMEVLEKKYHLN